MPVHEASWLAIDPAPGETLRSALQRVLRDAIIGGSLRAGVRLPSSRELARQLGVVRPHMKIRERRGSPSPGHRSASD